TSGVNDIRNNIKDHNFACEYNRQDTLVVATSRKGLQQLEIEHKNLSKFGYKTAIYDAQAIKNYVGSSGYVGGFGYEDTFNIKAYAYCQELKQYLQSQGVQIFEETPVTQVQEHRLAT